MDDATNEHYSMFFCEQEGTRSSLRGVREVIESKGLFCSLYTDRVSHYWHTPEAGGKVDRKHPTRFGRAIKQLGVEMIAAYSPQARGRSERAFQTHQDRLVKELAAAGITDMEQANAYLRNNCLANFNAAFMRPPRAQGCAFVPCPDLAVLDDILCEHRERTVGQDNCVQYKGLTLRIPADRSLPLRQGQGAGICRRLPVDPSRTTGTGALRQPGTTGGKVCTCSRVMSAARGHSP